MIKPSHYDDEGHVIPWWKALISSSLDSLYAIVHAPVETYPLGADVAITFDWDDCNIVISQDKVALRLRDAFGVQATSALRGRPGTGVPTAVMP